jgi:hypothetical protein
MSYFKSGSIKPFPCPLGSCWKVLKSADRSLNLGEVAKESIEERSSQVFKDNSAVGKSGLRMGEEYSEGWTRAQKSSQVWECNKVSDGAIVHMGNRYGGKSKL